MLDLWFQCIKQYISVESQLPLHHIQHDNLSVDSDLQQRTISSVPFCAYKPTKNKKLFSDAHSELIYNIIKFYKFIWDTKGFSAPYNRI